MKVFISILILIFSFQSLTKADDIRDFEIEGMSVGHSLLEFIDKNQVEKIRKQYNYPNKEIYILVIESNNLKLNIYDFIQVDIKHNDPDYKIVSLSGYLKFGKNINECQKKKNQIDNDIKLAFENLSVESYNKKHRADKTKKSINYITEFNFKSGDSIVTICEDWSNYMETEGYSDGLRVGIVTKKFYDWISNEAYK